MVEMWESLLRGDDQAIFFAIALYAFVVCLWSVIFQVRTSRWPKVEGRLLHAGLEKVGHENAASEQEYTASALYLYSVDGVEYEGCKVSTWVMTGSGALKNAGLAQLKGIKRLPGSEENDGVWVFYNPKKPNKSVLIIPGLVSQLVTAFLGSILFVLYAARYCF